MDRRNMFVLGLLVLFFILTTILYYKKDSRPSWWWWKFLPPDSYSTAEESTSNSGPLPNILLAGAPQAGTNFVYSWLVDAIHDADLCTPRPKLIQSGTTTGNKNSDDDGNHENAYKEVHFFDDNELFHQGVDAYRSLWEHCGATRSSKMKKYVIDATSDYLTFPDRVEQLYKNDERQQDCPGGTSAKLELKILIVLREPVAREMSEYDKLIRNVRGDAATSSAVKRVQKPDGTEWTFAQVMNRTFLLSNDGEDGPDHHQHDGDISSSFYVHHLKRWFAAFDRPKQILLLSFDELKSDPEAMFGRIHQFLGLGNAPLLLYGDTKEGRHNRREPESSVVPPSCSVQTWLADTVFKPFNTALYALLDENPGPEMEQRPFPRFQRPC